jgi:2,4-dienoyl-CoA reductase-like NADH-dependent reductase (Old Yellow Enzyme family)/thioredoxin reductase
MEKHPIYPHIFRPLKIGQTEVRNRIFVPAHTTNFGENNLPSDRHLAYHRARAAGGAGLIIFEGIRVHKSSLGRQQGVNGYEAKAIPKFREIAKAVQGEGARLFGQVLHLGRHIDGNFARMAAWSASSIPWTATAPAPHPMTVQEIKTVVDAHCNVAANLLEAGLDGIELQLAHGHLLQQFLSPIANQREDEYGGSFENRMRIVMETALAMRRTVGPKSTMGVRISADEFLEGGLTLEDMCQVILQLAAAVQLDFVNISHSAYHGSYTISTQMADMAFTNQQFRYLTEAISAALDGMAKKPVIMSVCRYNRVELAEEMLATGKADMIGMARAHVADPELVNKARVGRVEDTTPCIGCNQGCADMLAQSLAISCLANPRAGMEADWPAPALHLAKSKKPVLVVGGGPAGMEAAGIAAERGFSVTLIDRQPVLAGSLIWLEKMPLRREFLRLCDRQRRRLEQHKVELQLEKSVSTAMLDAYLDWHIIWAAGAKPQGQILANGETALSLEQALADPQKLGEKVVMVDHLGTWAVVSVAEYLADLGKQVTLIVPTGIAGWKISIYSSFALKHRLRKKNVQLIGGYRLVDFANGRADIADLSVQEGARALQADSVVAPLSGSPNAPPEINRPIYNAGDSISARTALEAVFEGHQTALFLSD